MISAWKGAREEEARLLNVPVPDALAGAAQVQLAALWEAAMREASAGQEALRRDLARSEATVVEAQAEAKEIIVELEADRDAVGSELANLSQVLDALRSERDEARA